ncbi:MAG: hypothetical protein JXR96_21495 [Deltaproteobacteria bacterium]|nr:hypothetical protein [Deltaproteobacteria bacterium]
MATLASGCEAEERAQLSIRIISPRAGDSDLRGFSDPEHPPEYIQIMVCRSSDTATPIVNMDEAWDNLKEDSGKKYLLIDIPPNEEDGDPYILQLASKVSVDGGFDVDECGTIGNILAARGAKVRLDVATHEEDCFWLCSQDEHCAGGAYCLSFECYPQPQHTCTVDEDCTTGAICDGGICDPPCIEDTDCPTGAHCDQGTCNAQCGMGLPECLGHFNCCAGICSQSCPAP